MTSAMELICLSVSHHNTPVEIRENLSLTPQAIEQALCEMPIRQGQFEAIREILVLSTCNRLEVYAVVTTPQTDNGAMIDQSSAVFSYLQQGLNIPVDSARPYFRTYQGIPAVQHLYRVAAGLDSIAIGENQILGQVARALDDALKFGTARHILPSLFRAAIHAGKRVRSETEIGRSPVSIVSIAAQLIEEKAGCLPQKNILIIGAGTMGELAIKTLQEIRPNIFITNRTYQKALDMAAQYGAQAIPFENLPQTIRQSDIIFSSVTSAHPILQYDMINAATKERSDRPLFILDLAVPRNAESSIRELDGVQLFDMDDVQSYAGGEGSIQNQNIALANTIVEEEVAEYEKLLRVIPLIGELHKKAENIRQTELARVMKNIPCADEKVVEQIDLFSRALVRKILHDPTMHLRTETNQDDIRAFSKTLTHLFDLSESDHEFHTMKGCQ